MLVSITLPGIAKERWHASLDEEITKAGHCQRAKLEQRPPGPPVEPVPVFLKKTGDLCLCSRRLRGTRWDAVWGGGWCFS